MWQYLIFNIQVVPSFHQLHCEGIYSLFSSISGNLNMDEMTSFMLQRLKISHNLRSYKCRGKNRTLFFRNSLTFLSSARCLSSVMTLAESPVFSLTAASSLASDFFRSSSRASKWRPCSPRCWTSERICKQICLKFQFGQSWWFARGQKKLKTLKDFYIHLDMLSS